MKKTVMFLIMVATLSIGACSKSQAQAPKTEPTVTTNYVVETVGMVEENAKCTPYYTDVGDDKVHSAVCKLANKVVVYCWMTAATGFACSPLNASPTPQTQPVAQTDPAVAPKKEPKK